MKKQALVITKVRESLFEEATCTLLRIRECIGYKLNEKEEIIDVNNPEQIVKGLVTRGRDEAKNIAVDNNGYVYVNVGSYDETCKEAGTNKGKMPCPLLDSVGGIWRFKTSQLNQQYGDGIRYATGLKNVVGLDWNSGTNSLFVLMHGRGNSTMFSRSTTTPKTAKSFLPKPCMKYTKATMPAGRMCIMTRFKRRKSSAPNTAATVKKRAARRPSIPLLIFRHTWDPTLCFFTPEKCFLPNTKTALLLLSTAKSPVLKKGYMVAFVPFKNGKPSGAWEVFADNFAGTDLVKPTGPIQHRPTGLAQGPDGSLYVTDDLNGTLYRIAYKALKK